MANETTFDGASFDATSTSPRGRSYPVAARVVVVFSGRAIKVEIDGPIQTLVLGGRKIRIREVR